MSFNIGLSGLSAASDDINITGNNITNVSTTGFKKSRAEFGDVYAASILGGGQNQHGSGVMLQNIGQDFSQGNINFTGKPLDLAINGKGFFVLSGSQGTTYSRAGAFGTDNQGNVVNNLGEKLQGYAPTSTNEASGGSGPLTDMVVTTGEIDPKATTEVTSILNLDAEAPPSSIIGSNLPTNGGKSSKPQFGVINPQAAQVFGTISTDGTDFSGTTPASLTGAFNVSNGLDFNTAGGNQGFSISVNGGGLTPIDLSGADTADGAALVTHVQTQLDAALTPPNNVTASIENNRLVLQTTQVGENSSISIGLVEGLAQNIVTTNATNNGKTAPPTGFSISYDGERQDIVIDEDFTNTGDAALERGGGTGSGNEALEDHIQNQINASAGLTGKVDVSINNDGLISFRAIEAGEHNITIDPRTVASESINFNQVVSFQTDRRAGTLDKDALDFSGANTSFKIQVGSEVLDITLSDNYNADGTAGASLGDDPEVGLEALEDEIQRQINTSTLNNKVRVSIGADGDIAFELTDPNETSLDVYSGSTAPQSVGSVDVSEGFNFDGGAGGTPYTFTVGYSVDGNPVTTSNAITVNGNFSNAQDLINSIQNAIDTDPNFQFNSTTREVEVAIDPVTGSLIIQTAKAGPQSQLNLTVTAPVAPDVIQDTGGAVLGTGPARDFDSYATFIGDELNNSGADGIDNGFTEEVIQVVDVNNRTQLVTIPEGASAHEVAQRFSSIEGVTAAATSVAYITGTNRGDPKNVGVGTDGVEGNLPLDFVINGHTFRSDAIGADARMAELADKINNSNSNLSARVVPDAIGDKDVLEITESNGLDLMFSGGSSGLGSITVVGSERDPITGEPVLPGNLIDQQQQLSNLKNLNQDAIVIGGTVDFVLEEGVTLADAETDLDGKDIPSTGRSIFGDITDPNALTGTDFELNDFDPDNPDTYYRSTAVAIYDSLGNQHTMTQYYVRERQAEGLDVLGSVWSVYFQIDGEDIGYDPANPQEPTLAKAEVQFDQNGRYKNQNNDIFITNWTPRDANGDPTTAAYGPQQGVTNNLAESNSSNFEIDLSNMTQFGGSFAVNSNTQDGYSSGQLVGLDVDDSGVLFARFSNGQSQVLGEVALADFENAEGLENLGGTRFAATNSSGAATPSAAGTAGLGAIQSGALEDSNVDLSDELVHMIIAQRNFQASAQIIEAADTTTQTIINL